MLSSARDVLSECMRKARRGMSIAIGQEQKVYLEKFIAAIPARHVLVEYQRRHPQYDRFLPRLAPLLPPHTLVIDVGANCGDTLFSIFPSAPDLHYICIEPYSPFYDYLLRNAEAIRRAYPGAKIETIQALIGKEVQWAHLSGTESTKKAVVSTEKTVGGLSSATLDDIVGKRPLSPISLIKSDVDGFDYDVINSAISLITRDKPMIFLECHSENPEQIKGYINTFSFLADNGYAWYGFFDNFGSFIVWATEMRTINELFTYVALQNKGISTRTTCYYDVLAVCSKDKEIADRAILAHSVTMPKGSFATGV